MGSLVCKYRHYISVLLHPNDSKELGHRGLRRTSGRWCVRPPYNMAMDILSVFHAFKSAALLKLITYRPDVQI